MKPPADSTETKRRGLADPIGFPHTRQQIAAVADRIQARHGARLEATFTTKSVAPSDRWRVAIAPHDDYAYAGFMYPLALRNLTASVVVIFGVAHKARRLGLENVLIFDAFALWRGPYGDVRVAPLRERLLGGLRDSSRVVHDEMHAIEHSIEAKLPFLQHAKRDVQIVPILVPAMSFTRMHELARELAHVLDRAFEHDGVRWGRDVAFVASTDAVHYGDEGWNGHDSAAFGADAEGYAKAVAHEHAILRDCFDGALQPERIERFVRYTLADHDHREYKWTWCGRYSVPFALLTAWHLQQLRREPPLNGMVLGYATSLGDQRIDVSDLDGMGVTAPATLRHWVGYAAVGYL